MSFSSTRTRKQGCELVASHTRRRQHQQKYGEDYRAEAKPNPVRELSDRKTDNTTIAREAKAPA
jgi:hypothetical protein